MAEYEDRRNPYERIAADMRALIMSGEWAPGATLPTTAELCGRFSAGSPTIQKALGVLKDEGWIVGQRGVDRKVRPTQIKVITAGTYFDPATTDYKYDLLGVSRETPQGDVAEKLGLGVEAILRHRVMRDANGPVEVEWSYYPTDVADGTAIAGPRKIKGGTQRILAEIGLPERNSADEVTARDATGEEARLLLLPPGVPVLRILRTTTSNNDLVVEVSVLVKASHLLAQRYPLIPKP